MATKMATEVQLSDDEKAILDAMPEEQRVKLLKLLASRSKVRRIDGKALEAKYPHMVEGSLGFDETAKKQFAVINCQQDGCEETRRVFTSDLFQAKVCVAHRDAARKAKREEQMKLLADFKAAKMATAEPQEVTEPQEA